METNHKVLNAYEKDMICCAQNYYEFTYNPLKNPYIILFPKGRTLTISVDNKILLNDKQYDIGCNAFSIYENDKDCIFIGKELVNSLINIIWNADFPENRQDWMITVSLGFCVFHELAHLLVGHCQLTGMNRLTTLDSSLEKSQLDIHLYQALELDADLFASRRIAEFAASRIKFGEIGLWGYDDERVFYNDTMRAIISFFFVLIIQEMYEANRKHDIAKLTGEKQRGCQENEATHVHPPALARASASGSFFMQHMEQFYKISGDKEEFKRIFYSMFDVFGGQPLSKEKFQKIYLYVLDGTFESTLDRLMKYYKRVVRTKLLKYSRIPLL